MTRLTKSYLQQQYAKLRNASRRNKSLHDATHRDAMQKNTQAETKADPSYDTADQKLSSVLKDEKKMQLFRSEEQTAQTEQKIRIIMLNVNDRGMFLRHKERNCHIQTMTTTKQTGTDQTTILSCLI